MKRCRRLANYLLKNVAATRATEHRAPHDLQHHSAQATRFHSAALKPLPHYSAQATRFHSAALKHLKRKFFRLPRMLVQCTPHHQLQWTTPQHPLAYECRRNRTTPLQWSRHRHRRQQLQVNDYQARRQCEATCRQARVSSQDTIRLLDSQRKRELRPQRPCRSPLSRKEPASYRPQWTACR